MSTHDDVTDAPPIGEEIHLPAPSGLPIVNAAGLALAIVSITISIVPVILGVVIFLITSILWIRNARREFDELPAEHHQIVH
jgi:hypothetical protein